MLGMNCQAKPLKQLLAIVLVAVLGWGMTSCSQPTGSRSLPSKPTQGRLAEVSAPVAIQALKPLLDNHRPQVKILSPRPNQVLEDTEVEVRLKVSDLSLYQSSYKQELAQNLGDGTDQTAIDAGAAEFDRPSADSTPPAEPDLLSSYLQIWLDNQPYAQVDDLSSPLKLVNLTPGTHTIRAFAVRPWHESFKNEEAFAQTTFHIFTPTSDHQPQPDRPLLTYSSPQGTYGAEPILLDFYLTNAPLHLVARQDETDDISDWQIRCTINGESFSFDRWEPIYLKGIKPGKNWVKLELLDEQGNLIENAFNSTVQLFTYEPNGTDPLSRLVRGELTANAARQLIDPTYLPPAPAAPTDVPDISPNEAEVMPASPELPSAIPSEQDPNPELQGESNPESYDSEPSNREASDLEPSDPELNIDAVTTPKANSAVNPDTVTEPEANSEPDPEIEPDRVEPASELEAATKSPPEVLIESPVKTEPDSRLEAQSEPESATNLEPPVPPVTQPVPDRRATVELPSAEPSWSQSRQSTRSQPAPAPIEPSIPPLIQAPSPQPVEVMAPMSEPETTAETTTKLEQSLDNLEKALEQIFQSPPLEPTETAPQADPVTLETQPLELFPRHDPPASSLTSPYPLPSPDETPDLLDLFDRVKDFFEGLRK